MPFEKIGPAECACLHPEHNPPGGIVLDPGVYKYTCPACGKETVIHVPLVRIAHA